MEHTEQTGRQKLIIKFLLETQKGRGDDGKNVDSIKMNPVEIRIGQGPAMNTVTNL